MVKIENGRMSWKRVCVRARIHLVYPQLVDFENDDCPSAPANTVKEANKLIDAGFEYVALATTQYSSENASKRPYYSSRQR